MSEKCKYCDYVSKCSRFCEYNSIMCLMRRSFPKIVDKTYEELEKENQELKKQLKEYEHHLKISKEMLDLQSQDGNYNYDNYMLGLYNGMEYIMSLFEVREPIFKDGKNIKFLNDKNQQKEFIEWLEDSINILETEQARRFNHEYQYKIDTFKNCLLKYKEIVGDKNEVQDE